MSEISGNNEQEKNLDKTDDKKVLYKTMAFKVEEDLHTALKLNSVKKNKQMGTIVNELIRDYLKSQNNS